jgi:hypothetical protein
VLLDSVVSVSKNAQINVPQRSSNAVCYSVKFICGNQEEGCDCAPIGPGQYATQISIHNYSGERVEVRKRIIPVVLTGAPLGGEPKVSKTRAEDLIKLPPHTATMDDCCRITELLFGAPTDPLTIGLLEIIASRDISVTALYTSGTSVCVQLMTGRPFEAREPHS